MSCVTLATTDLERIEALFAELRALDGLVERTPRAVLPEVARDFFTSTPTAMTRTPT